MRSGAILAGQLEVGPHRPGARGGGRPHQVRGRVGLMGGVRSVRRSPGCGRRWIPPTARRICGSPHRDRGTLEPSRRRGHTPQKSVSSRHRGDRDAGGSDRFATLLAEVGRAAAEDRPRPPSHRSGSTACARRGRGRQRWSASRLAALAALERVVVELADARPDLSTSDLAVLLWSLAEMGYRGDPGTPAERRGVQVMTVHQAKGLEFDAVFVVGFTHAGWPGRNRPGPDIPDALIPESIPRDAGAHDAESRRLAYVAMTRARKHLTLCWTAASDGGVPQRVSHFAEESMDALGGVSPEEVGGGGPACSAPSAGRDALGPATMAAAEPGPRAARAVSAAPGSGQAGGRLHPLPPPPFWPRLGLPPGLHLGHRYRRYQLPAAVPVRPSTTCRPDRTRPGVAAIRRFRHTCTGGPGPDASIHALRRRAAPPRRAGLAGLKRPGARRESFPKLVRRSSPAGSPPRRGAAVHPGARTAPRARRIDRVDRSPDGGYALVDYKTGSPEGRCRP